MVSMQSSAQEVTMLFKLIAATKDSWTCFVKRGYFLHADFEISVNGGWGDQNGASFLEFLAVAKGGG